MGVLKSQVTGLSLEGREQETQVVDGPVAVRVSFGNDARDDVIGDRIDLDLIVSGRRLIVSVVAYAEKEGGYTNRSTYLWTDVHGVWAGPASVLEQ